MGRSEAKAPHVATEERAFPEECFVDIPANSLEASSEQEESAGEEAESMIMDVDSLLQPDYSGYTFWSSDSLPSETQGAAEIWRTGAGVFLPPTSSDQTLLSSLARRQSDESLQSSLASGHAPFKSGYCRSESGLFAGTSQTMEPMRFVPSSVCSEVDSQKLQGAVENPKKRVYKRKSGGEQTSSIVTAPKRLKINVTKQKKSNAGKGRPGSGAKKSASKKRTELELLRLSAGAVSDVSVKKENTDAPLNTPTSTVSDFPIESSRVRAKTKAGGSTETKDNTQTVLRQSSPNLPRRLTKSSVQKLQMPAPNKASQKSGKAKTVQKNLADEAESERSKLSDKEVGTAKIEPESDEQLEKLPPGYRSRKTSKRTILPEESLQVLKDWAKSSDMVPYPDKETKQKLAEESHLTVYQVDNWLAGARNRTHLIKVPQKLKLLNKACRSKAGSAVQEIEE